MKPIILLGLILATATVVSSKNIKDDEGRKKMVCYYGTWAVYRPGAGKFDVESIKPDLLEQCTHIIYGFAKLQDNQIMSYDPWQDLYDNYGKGGFLRFTNLKNEMPGIKFLIAIGGWNEGSEKYSDMAGSPLTRKTFVDSVKPFLEKYNFDGLDLDWEYPTARGGKPEDKESFKLLVRELRKALGSRYLLTAAVSPNVETVANAYDVPSISKDLDFISVMCYDYNGAWNTFTGHNTPLYRNPLDETHEPFFNVNDTVNYWLNAGLPKEKFVMGMALYGRGFLLDKAKVNGLYAPASMGIPEGPYTRQDGTWGYNEICEVFQRESDDWKIVIDPYYQAPYAYNGRKWIGYDDVESLYKKAKFALDMGLAGAMVWSIETDDFQGTCHNEKYILIKTIAKTMNGGGMPKLPKRPEVVEPNEIGEATTSQTVTGRPQTTVDPDEEEEEAEVPTTEAAPTATGKCNREGLIPVPGDCTKYLSCVRDGDGYRTYVQSCAPGLAFDPAILGCNFPSSVPGCNKLIAGVEFYRNKNQ